LDALLRLERESAIEGDTRAVELLGPPPAVRDEEPGLGVVSRADGAALEALDIDGTPHRKIAEDLVESGGDLARERRHVVRVGTGRETIDRPLERADPEDLLGGVAVDL